MKQTTKNIFIDFRTMSFQRNNSFAAASLNNEAASQIDKGDYLLASQLLATALSTLKATMKASRGKAPSRQSEISATCVCAFSGDASTRMSDQSKNVFMQVDDYFIYKRPIQVFNSSAVSEMARSTIGIISYSIVYKLALCHHLRAISDIMAAGKNHAYL
jgi:hypothetical protein